MRNIIFDLGGVIIDTNIKKTFNEFCKLGVDLTFEDFDSKFISHETHFKYEMGNVATNEFFLEVKKSLAFDPTFDQFAKAWNALLLDIPEERIDLLFKLRKNHKLYLLSNTNDLHYNEIVKRFIEKYGKNLFDDIFTQQFYSHIIGKRKPLPDIYEYVIEEAGLVPSETLFVDDRADNIKASAEFGIKPLLLDKNKTIVDVFPI